MYTSAIAVYMAKLYWRVKVDGRWTFRPALIDTMNANFMIVHRWNPNAIMEEEE